MISRVAEHCYWMSRYLERAENTARVLDVNRTLLLDFEVPFEQQWKPVLIITGCHFDEHWQKSESSADAETVQNYMTWERDNLSSIINCVGAARENARVIREVVSLEMWEKINADYLWLNSPQAKRLYEIGRSEFYKRIKEMNQTVHGVSDDTMSHGEAWEFLQLGRYIERGSQTARIVDVKFHMLLPDLEHFDTPVDNAQWTAVLKSCSAYEPFHKQRRIMGAELGTAVAEYLLFDAHFPRSVRRCMVECRQAAHAISGRPFDRPGNEVERTIDDLVTWLFLSNIGDFVKFGLHEALTSVIDRIHDIGSTIHGTYFDFRIETPADGGKAA